MPQTPSTQTQLPYYEDFTPGSGALDPARSWLDSSSRTLVLDGPWRFRLSPSPVGLDESVAAPDFDDSGWDTIPVPSHWVLEGHGAYGLPQYTNVQYPFPIDPPYVPDANPTGDYRRSFELPGGWRPGGRTLLRFDGVESTFKVWVNGHEVGTGKGSRLSHEFDVTEALTSGANTIAVRVHQFSSASYLEDQDQWWLPGIFRGVTLLERPVGGLDDVWLTADFDHTTGRGTITPEIRAADVAFPVSLDIVELGVHVTWATAADVAPVAIAAVDPWSAEIPRLYTAVVTGAAESVELRLGFRTVRIVGDLFTVNGARVVFHGVNRHEAHPVRGRVFDADHARADLELMKRHNINAIRTSHYPPHPILLDIADELGFWVIDECDLETHGFEAADNLRNPARWDQNPSDDGRWEAAYLDRIERTVERDKNHPSVVLWSLGNESGTGRNLALMSQWVHRRDPGRPVHYEGDYTGQYTDVYSRMYASLEETESIGSDSIPGLLLDCTAGESARNRLKPFILCEYVHAMGNGPGSIAEYEALTVAYPRLHGGFVWEWRDHGILTRTADGVPFHGYGGDFGEVVHDGNFVMDGMILSDDIPTPGLAEYRAVVQPIVFGALVDGAFPLHNRYHSASTAHLRFAWSLERDGHEMASSDLEVPCVAAGESASVALPDAALSVSGTGEWWVTVRAVLSADVAWAARGHVVAVAQYAIAGAGVPGAPVGTSAGAQHPLAEGGTAGGAAGGASGTGSGIVDGDAFVLGGARFDLRTGSLRSLGSLAVDGPQLELWRAPTDNDRSDSRGSYELGDPKLTFGEGVPGPPSEIRWRGRGLDRLVHRVTSVVPGEVGLDVRVRTSAANNRDCVETTYRWTVDTQGALALRVEIAPSRGWDTTWPRMGIRFALPGTLETADWFGTGPLESYPDSRRAALVGRYSSAIDALSAGYARPQETGHRSDVRELTLGESGGAELDIRFQGDEQGRLPGFTASRHTAHEIDAATHPHELPASSHVHLYVDAAQHGLGSRACGIDVLPQYALWPSARSLALTLSVR
ncbi:MAG: DUF4981 domain-containing protein [Burkholderiaceae bacterium]|nr:DUF4981 domain-containing protein [Microbacteriaceae bacterium]